MPAPLVGLAVGAAARAVAKKVAGNAVKKAVTKKAVSKTAKANARALKAANKPTKAAKTGIGNNEKISVEVRRGALKNEPPARANRTRGGGMATLKKQQAEKRIAEAISKVTKKTK